MKMKLHRGRSRGKDCRRASTARLTPARPGWGEPPAASGGTSAGEENFSSLGTPCGCEATPTKGSILTTKCMHEGASGVNLMFILCLLFVHRFQGSSWTGLDCLGRVTGEE